MSVPLSAAAGAPGPRRAAMARHRPGNSTCRRHGLYPDDGPRVRERQAGSAPAPVRLSSPASCIAGGRARRPGRARTP